MWMVPSIACLHACAWYMCTCECLHGIMCTVRMAAHQLMHVSAIVCVRLYARRYLSYAACAGVDLHVLYVRCACLPMRTQLHLYVCVCVCARARACVLAHGNIDVSICAGVRMAFSMACACNTTCGACACAHGCMHACLYLSCAHMN